MHARDTRVWAPVAAVAILGGCAAMGWAQDRPGQEATVQKPTSQRPVERAPGVTDATVGSYEDRSVTVAEGAAKATFHYRLLRPASIASGTRYPVVLFLHGAGERGDDNLRQLKYLPAWMAEPAAREAYPCFVIAPQCREGERWVDVAWGDPQSSPQPPQPGVDLAAALAALDAVLMNEPCAADRVYLTGLSMGGYGTWDLAARMPERFAAAVPICGGGDERTATRLVHLPLWAFHGDADKAVPVERSRTMIAAVKSAGGMPRYTELPGVGHDSWTPAYRDPKLLDWLFSQRRIQAR
jgi:predicted peptidase